MLDFSLKPTIEGATHWSEEINQLYHPTAIFEQDSQDLVYAADNINITKFAPILLKEWFFYYYF